MVGAKITLERIETDAEMVEREKGIPKEISKVVLQTVIENRQNNKRQPKPPPPEGGISIRAGGRKYGIPNPTISIWVKRGYIPVLLETKNEKYIDEKRLAELADMYKQNPGQGKLTIKRAIYS